MRYTLKTRFLTMLLAVVMVMGLPMNAFAAEAGGTAVAANAGDFSSTPLMMITTM